MDENRMKDKAKPQAFDASGACQAWVLHPPDNVSPLVPSVAGTVALGIVWWMLPPGIYPMAGVLLLASPMILVAAFVHEILFAKKLVRVGRDGVYRPALLGTSFVAWRRIKEADVTREALVITLRDGSHLRLRFARPLTSREEVDLRHRIRVLRVRPLQSHPLALRDGESPDAWLARIRAASLDVADYQHTATEHEELSVLANNSDLLWTARLAALVRLHLAGVEGLAAMQARIADEYAACQVTTAFRVADLGDRPLLMCCKGALKMGALTAGEDAHS